MKVLSTGFAARLKSVSAICSPVNLLVFIGTVLLARPRRASGDRSLTQNASLDGLRSGRGAQCEHTKLISWRRRRPRAVSCIDVPTRESREGPTSEFHGLPVLSGARPQVARRP